MHFLPDMYASVQIGVAGFAPREEVPDESAEVENYTVELMSDLFYDIQERWKVSVWSVSICCEGRAISRSHEVEIVHPIYRTQLAASTTTRHLCSLWFP